MVSEAAGLDISLPFLTGRTAAWRLIAGLDQE